MIDVDISDGDEIIVDRSWKPHHGNIVVAAIDGEFTVKRFEVDRTGQGWLIPVNPDYSPILIAAGSDFLIFGVVTSCIHHV